MKKFKRINIEISNICNLACSFCPEVGRDKKVMGLELLDQTLEQVAPLTEEVCLHLMGEPLGHPQLSECIDLCTKHGTPVNLTTNGTLLNDRTKEILLRPIIRQVNFSIHSFEANFKDQDVSRYIERIFAFTDEAFALRPELYINYRLWDLKDPVSLSSTNQSLRNKIKEKYQFELDPATVDLKKKKSYRMINRLYMHLDSRFVWPSMKEEFRSDRGYCHALHNHFGVHADGTVVPCCLDKEADLKLGDLNHSSLNEILNSERALAIRNGFKNRKCVEELCKRCDFIQRFDLA